MRLYPVRLSVSQVPLCSVRLRLERDLRSSLARYVTRSSIAATATARRMITVRRIVDEYAESGRLGRVEPRVYRLHVRARTGINPYNALHLELTGARPQKPFDESGNAIERKDSPAPTKNQLDNNRFD